MSSDFEAILTPSILLDKLWSSISREEAESLIERHFTHWDIATCIPNRLTGRHLVLVCEYVVDRIKKAEGAAKTHYEHLASRFYQRVFSYELHHPAPEKYEWFDSAVFDLLPFVIPQVKLECARLLFAKLRNEGCVFDPEKVIRGEASIEELKSIAHYLHQSDKPKLIPYLICFGQKATFVHICATEYPDVLIQGLDRFGFDRATDRVELQELAQLCAKKAGDEVLYYLCRFGLDPQETEHRAIIMKIAQFSKRQLPDSFRLDPSHPEDRQALIVIAQERIKNLPFFEVYSSLRLKPDQPEHRQLLLEIAESIPYDTDWKRYLIFKQLGIEDAPELKASSLFGALFAHDVDGVAKLLQQGISPNIQDDRGLTPLHYAAMHNLPGMIRLLIEAGANIEAKGGSTVSIGQREPASEPYVAHQVKLQHKVSRVHIPENSTPVTLAAWYGCKEALAELLRHSPNCDVQNGYGFSARYAMYANRITECLEQVPPTAHTERTYITKLLAHVSGVVGSIAIDDAPEFHFEGNLTEGMYREIAASLPHFHSLFDRAGLSIQAKQEIAEVMQRASIFRSAEELYEEIREGKITVIPTGYHGHYASMIVEKWRTTTCDGSSSSPSKAYPISAEKFTSEILKIILENRTTTLHTESVRYSVLDQLGGRFAGILEDWTKQSIGNCSYYAPKMALRRVVLSIVRKHQIPNGETLHLEYGHDHSTYMRLETLKRYLRTIPHPDPDLVHSSFAKILRHMTECTPFVQAYCQSEVAKLQETHPELRDIAPASKKKPA